MVSLRLWTQGDIDYVAESVNREGWRHLKRDVERCWRFEPDGCFIAEVEGKPVGHVFSICYCKVGWTGLLIVNPENRGKGIGAALMQKVISYLRGEEVETIRLEAVEKAVPLYRRLGFKEEFPSLRFVGRLKHGLSNESNLKGGNKTKILEIEAGDLEQLAGFDFEYFGADRLRILRSLYDDRFEGGCFMAKRGERILGYAMSRRIQDGFWVGPWVCASPEVAERLLRACVDSIALGGKKEFDLRVGMPAPNRAGVSLMGKLGFNVIGSSLRMVWGKRKHEGAVSGVYGIGGAEKG
jgi:GNAT superfamily N-acetyltransferase